MAADDWLIIPQALLDWPSEGEYGDYNAAMLGFGGVWGGEGMILTLHGS